MKGKNLRHCPTRACIGVMGYIKAGWFKGYWQCRKCGQLEFDPKGKDLEDFQ